MISALKVLFTVAVILIVFWGFKYRWRMGEMGKSLRKGRKQDSKDAPARSVEAQDLEQCPKCGAYIPAGSACSCEKA